MGEDDDKAANARLAAAAWVERLTSVKTPRTSDIVELKAWLAADPLHRPAYEQARALWVELDRTTLARPRRMPRMAGMAMAASLAAVMWWGWPAGDLVTPQGQLRQVRLSDGTQVWLDSASALDVRIDATSRSIWLLKGRAAFDVAKDTRPFSVVAGDARITDIGTMFSVDRSDGLTVDVSRGAVDVARAGRHVVLSGGQGAGFGDGDVRFYRVVDDAFTWRDHRLVLDNVRLKDALAALDRYYPGRLILTASDLAGNRVSGTLRVDRPEAALETLMRSQHLRATKLPWLTLVSRDDE